MASLADIGVSAFINILFAFLFLLGFAFLRLQPINDRVYFPKWYLTGGRTSPRNRGNFVGKFIFIPITILALVVLVPINELVISNIDKLSISNVSPKSEKVSCFFPPILFWAHIGMAYVFTFWVCYILYKEYDRVAFMRLHFWHHKVDVADQFTVVVRNIPHVAGHSTSESVDHFFQNNHSDHYIGHQAVYNANKFAKLVRRRDRLQQLLDYNQLKFKDIQPGKGQVKGKVDFVGYGEKVDSIEFYQYQMKELEKMMASERQRILKDPKSIMPVAFVSFDSRWAAAVCAQTQQSKNPTWWLTYWAPEPRDVYWRNLAIPFVSLSIRKLIIAITVFALVFFYMIPIAFVQSLANLEGLGHLAISVLERKAAAKYYYFMLVNVFLGSIVTGTAFEQLDAFLHQSPTQIPRNIGVSIPMKGTFFITYIMVSGWAGIASEILERDRVKAMDPGSVQLAETLPSLQLYFLLGIVYAVITPILLPFILVFFGFVYLVYRHQIINVYNQQYESVAAFWPHVHSRIIGSLLISHLLLFGLLSTKKAAHSTPFLILLPILTIWFQKYCKSRFEPAFRKYPLEVEEVVEMTEVRVDKRQSHYMNHTSTNEVNSPSPPQSPPSPCLSL
ncbi:hypothetical protein MKW92_049521 [Papaver armeniacum]|nr:hypothetical protein MKW92_049521 [Papaver armeniacum]